MSKNIRICDLVPMVPGCSIEYERDFKKRADVFVFCAPHKLILENPGMPEYRTMRVTDFCMENPFHEKEFMTMTPLEWAAKELYALYPDLRPCFIRKPLRFPCRPWAANCRGGRRTTELKKKIVQLVPMVEGCKIRYHRKEWLRAEQFTFQGPPPRCEVYSKIVSDTEIENGRLFEEVTPLEAVAYSLWKLKPEWFLMTPKHGTRPWVSMTGLL